ncbi:MAG TPA: polysaccharide pyruvyl transferase CsaB [Capsulimonadaceae bacterium]|jgi:polysaccharide pyruvyl transferase CsaB
MKRIVLSGYYGFDNAGDEAVLAGLVRALRTRAASSELAIEALSIAPDATRTAHGIDSAHRMQLGSVMRSLASADLVASGGGSLLQDSTSRHSIFYYLAIVRIAQMLGKKTMFVAQGIGPLNLQRSRKLTASVANRLDAITVRDDASAALLRAIGCTRPPIEVTADPALLLGSPTPVLGRSGVGVALREWQGETAQLAGDLALAYRTTLAGAPIIDMPMMRGADEAANAAFINAAGGEARRGNGELADLLQQAAGVEMVLGMRLHALIFAAASGTPSVALSYDPKVAAFMAQTGQQDAVYDIASRNPEALRAMVAKVWSERGARAAALAARLPALRTRAQRNADVAVGLLGL